MVHSITYENCRYQYLLKLLVQNKNYSPQKKQQNKNTREGEEKVWLLLSTKDGLESHSTHLQQF